YCIKFSIRSTKYKIRQYARKKQSLKRSPAVVLLDAMQGIRPPKTCKFIFHIASCNGDSALQGPSVRHKWKGRKSLDIERRRKLSQSSTFNTNLSPTFWCTTCDTPAFGLQF